MEHSRLGALGLSKLARFPGSHARRQTYRVRHVRVAHAARVQRPGVSGWRVVGMVPICEGALPVLRPRAAQVEIASSKPGSIGYQASQERSVARTPSITVPSLRKFHEETRPRNIWPSSQKSRQDARLRSRDGRNAESFSGAWVAGVPFPLSPAVLV